MCYIQSVHNACPLYNMPSCQMLTRISKRIYQRLFLRDRQRRNYMFDCRCDRTICLYRWYQTATEGWKFLRCAAGYCLEYSVRRTLNSAHQRQTHSQFRTSASDALLIPHISVRRTLNSAHQRQTHSQFRTAAITSDTEVTQQPMPANRSDIISHY